MKHSATELIKFKRLVRRLRTELGDLPISGETVVVGLLERLWHAAIRDARDGRLGDKMTDEDIAESVGWYGQPEALIDALVDTGWLDRAGETVIVHDWADHMPNWLKGLSRRGQNTQPSPAPSAGPSTEPSTEPSAAPSTEPVPQPPNLTKPNLTKPNKETASAVLAETGEDAGTATTDDPVVLNFPCDGTKKTWNLRASLVARYRNLYPSLDLEREFRQALAWIEANPSQRKTYTGMQRFLTGWLNRSQNRGQPARASPSRSGDPKYDTAARSSVEDLIGEGNEQG